jgi:hypothetical protein
MLVSSGLFLAPLAEAAPSTSTSVAVAAHAAPNADRSGETQAAKRAARAKAKARAKAQARARAKAKAHAKTNASAIVQWSAPNSSIFSPTSVWRTPVTTAPLNPHSAAMARYLAYQVAEYYGGTAAFNAWTYNVSFVTVPASQPRLNVVWNNCQNKDYTPDGLVGPGGVLTGVPIPARTQSAAGTDGELTIYSPSSDQLWELWQAQKNASGQWTACWGGRIDHVSTSPGYFDNGFGASASGLAISGGMVSFADLKRGYINHALSLAIPDPAPWNDISWPAQRSDGSPQSTSDIPEGTRFRLPANINLANLHLTPLALMIAKAAQRYGFIVSDQSGAVAITGESGSNVKAATGSNPWDSVLRAVPCYLQLKDFPWASLQALPQNWGKPAS